MVEYQQITAVLSEAFCELVVLVSFSFYARNKLLRNCGRTKTKADDKTHGRHEMVSSAFVFRKAV